MAICKQLTGLFDCGLQLSMIAVYYVWELYCIYQILTRYDLGRPIDESHAFKSTFLFQSRSVSTNIRYFRYY